MARSKEPLPGRYPVSFGEVELLRDLDRPDGWMLIRDGVPQSYVDLTDPTYLDFSYTQLMASVIDCLPEGPLDAVHIGGGACTIPRYISARRPAPGTSSWNPTPHSSSSYATSSTSSRCRG